MHAPPPSASPSAAGRLAAALGRAEAAAGAQVQAGPQATGERLHSNFVAVLNTVEQHDGHLLADLERDFMAAYRVRAAVRWVQHAPACSAYALGWVSSTAARVRMGFAHATVHRRPAPRPAQALPLPAQCLFLRLSQRKGPCFRLGALSYKEVPDTAEAAAQLAAAGLAVLLGDSGAAAAAAASRAASPGPGSPAAAAAAGAAADWRQLADLLTVPDLAALLSARRFQLASGAAVAGATPRGRAQLLEALERHAARSAAAARELVSWLLAAAGPVLTLAGGACEAVGRLQRLFFLSEGQSLSQVRAGIACC